MQLASANVRSESEWLAIRRRKLPTTPLDRHRGGAHPPTPATPPCVRVRTWRFEMVTLVHILQIRESERFEIGCGKRDGYGLGVGEVPGTATATDCVASQFWTDTQCQESCPTTTDCFPLSPECHTKSRTDPASKVREDVRSFAETEVAAPAPHIRDQFRHRRIDADALCTSCDLPDSPLKRSKDFGAIARLTSGPSVKVNPRNFRSCGLNTAPT